MFNLKYQQELYLDKNNIVLMLGCSFIVNQNNSFKNFFEFVINNENVDLENYYKIFITKEELIKKLFYYENSKVKKYIENSINIFCSYENKMKNIFSINKKEEKKYLMLQLFLSEFKNEIDIIENMTTNKDYKFNLTSHNINLWKIITKYL